MLTSFTPTTGPRAGTSYTLPYPMQQPTVTPHLATDTLVPIAHSVGSMDSAGTGVQFLASAEIDVSFLITPNWMILRGYNTGSDVANCTTALIDLAEYLVAGGEGTLTITLPTGTKHGNGGATLTTGTCTAKVSGDPQVTPRDGGTSAQVDIVFLVRSAQITLSDGTLIPLMVV